MAKKTVTCMYCGHQFEADAGTPKRYPGIYTCLACGAETVSFSDAKEIIEWMASKMGTCQDYGEWWKQKPWNKERLLEIMVENIVHDIVQYGKLRHSIGVDPSPPLTDVSIETMKHLLFKHLGLVK